MEDIFKTKTNSYNTHNGLMLSKRNVKMYIFIFWSWIYLVFSALQSFQLQQRIDWQYNKYDNNNNNYYYYHLKHVGCYVTCTYIFAYAPLEAHWHQELRIRSLFKEISCKYVKIFSASKEKSNISSAFLKKLEALY